MKRGFTLIEMLVAIALTAIVLIALASMIEYFYKANVLVIGQWQQVGAARKELDAAAQEFREGTSTTVDYPFDSFVQPTFTYYDASGTPLTAPIDPTQVRSVLMSATVGGVTILDGAALRNLASTTAP